MRKIIILSAILSFVYPTYGQLSVSRAAPDNTVNYLVRNVLLGGGVIVSNITYNGDDTAIGFFNGINSNIGIDSGFIMTNSTVTDAPGPNNSPSKGYQWPDCTSHSDSDLAALIGDTYTDTYSAAVLQFDFIPYSDTVRFEYVFGSEEYPEFVGSPFNDVFGFFVSGPGISGPYTHNAENIALIPNTVTPVSINNVNCNLNYNYYVCNWPSDTVFPCSVGCPTRPQMPSTTVQYDGFTVPLTATAIVQCGEQYHIKLAICNIGDCNYGSAVFFQSGSFSSGGTTVDTKINFANDSFPNDTILYRGGCDSASLYFQRGYSNTPDTIFIDTSGSASPGIDYTPLPDTVILSNGVLGDTLNIHAFSSLQKGLKTIVLSILQRRCGILDTQKLTIYIGEPDSIKIAQPPVKVCYGDSVLISPAVSGGLVPYVYKWNTGSTTSSIWVHSITPDTVFTLRVTGACSDTTVDSIHIISLGIAPLKLTAKDTTIYCPDTIAIPLSVFTSGGQPAYRYVWSTGATTSSISVSQFATKIYTVKVYDSCNHEQMDTIKVTVVNPALNLSTRDTTINCLDKVTLAANANGGGAITYAWSTGATSSSIQVKPNHDTAYIVTAYSPCGNQEKTDTIKVNVNSVPLAVTTGSTPIQCPGDMVTISAQAIGSGYISYLWQGLGKGSSRIVYPKVTTTYYVTVFDSCGNQRVRDSVTIYVPSFPALQLTVYPDTFTICKEDTMSLYASASGGTGNYTYQWSSTGLFSDTIYNANSSHAYLRGNISAIYRVKITDACGDTVSGDVVINVIPDCSITIPNVITPNGDNRNDYFYIGGLDKFPNSKLMIYNRWGKMVYESDDYQNNWNGVSEGGSELSDGVYYYIIYLSNGKNYSGFIQLIR